MAAHNSVKLLVVVLVATLLTSRHFAVLALPRASTVNQEAIGPVNQVSPGKVLPENSDYHAPQDAVTNGAKLLGEPDIQQSTQDKPNPLLPAYKVYETLPKTLTQIAASGLGRVQQGAESEAFGSIMRAYCTVNSEMPDSDGLVVLTYFGATDGSAQMMIAHNETEGKAIVAEFYPFAKSEDKTSFLPTEILKEFVQTSSKKLPSNVPFTSVIMGIDGWHLFRFGRDEFEAVDKLIKPFRTASVAAAPGKQFSMQQHQNVQPWSPVPSQLHRRSPLVGAILGKILANTAMSGATHVLPTLLGKAVVTGSTAATKSTGASVLSWLGKNVPGIAAGTAATALYREYSEKQTKQEAIANQSEIFRVCTLYCDTVDMEFT
ncbi:hypothetical protein H4R35_000384 [Dimargaris xerosporica]|nr:hypothetical protein H4R35_000384 [Dimargaris xerosporica]